MRAWIAKSEHDGWTYGYSFKALVVSATPDATVFRRRPRWMWRAPARPGSFREKVAELPSTTINVSTASPNSWRRSQRPRRR